MGFLSTAVYTWDTNAVDRLLVGLGEGPVDGRPEQSVSHGATDVRPRAPPDAHGHGRGRAPPRDQPDLNQPRRRAAEGDALHRRDRLGPPGRELLPVPEEGERDPRRGLPQDGRVDRQDDRRQADKGQGPRRPRPVPRPPRRLVGWRDGDGGWRVLGPVARLVPPTRPGPTPTTPRRPRRGGRRYPVLTDIRNVAPVLLDTGGLDRGDVLGCLPADQSLGCQLLVGAAEDREPSSHGGRLHAG